MAISDPTDLTGLAFWHDFSDASTITFGTGSLVAQINDKSGNARHLANSDGATQPDRNVSFLGRTVCQFASDFLQYRGGSGANIVSGTTMSFAIVWRPDAVSNRILSFNADADLDHLNPGAVFQQPTDPQIERHTSGGSPNTINPAGTTNTGQWYYHVVIFDGTNCKIRQDGVQIGTGASSGTFNIDQINMGANMGDPPWDNGSIAVAEVFATTTDVSTTGTELADLEEYIRSRWFPVVFNAIGAKSAGGTTTVSIAHPAGTGADQMLLAGRCGWLDTITFTNETGWTNTIQDAGGTGTSADNHTTEIRVDRKELAAADAGPTVFDQAGTISGCLGVMLSYLKTPGDTWDVVLTAGSDSTHAADRSVTAAAPTLALAPGDMVVCFVAVDTDVALTITNPLITAASITFGPTTRRTPATAGVTTGLDGNIEVFDAFVYSGSASSAPALNFTTATSQCGPVAFVRLRSVPPPAGVPFGSARRRRPATLIPHLAKRMR